jgi:hypothetical protein
MIMPETQWSRTMATPIEVPDTWPNGYPNKRGEYLKKHPYWGWLIAYFLYDRFAALDSEVKGKLQSRHFSIEEAWRDYPDLIDDAKRIQNLMKENLWGFSPVFIPSDSYWLLGQLLTGDLGELEMIMAIEEEYKIKIPDDYFKEDITMLNFINYIKGETGLNEANRPRR